MQAVLHLHILASGSGGNATLVETPEGTILIDCGLSLKELHRRADELGVSLEAIKAAFITHEHSDHVSGLSVFCKHFSGSLYATSGTAGAHTYLQKLPFTFIDANESLEICGVRVSTFSTSHDVADSFGLIFEYFDETGRCIDKIGYCTDTGMLSRTARKHLHGARILALEANHDIDLLAHGPYPEFLKARVGGSKGHLSNAQSAELLPELISEDTETVVAMHLSEKNNRPSTCIRTLAAAVSAQPTNTTFTEAQTPDGKLSLLCAAQNKPLSIY